MNAVWGGAIVRRCITVIACLLYCLFINVSFPVYADANRVAVVKISGEIDSGQTALVSRALNDAKAKNYKAVVIEIDTYGGLVDAAVKIRDKLLDTSVGTICYIKNRAWSAGALIAISAKHIAIAPGGSIGAAEPIPSTEKNIAALKAEFAATANKTGRNPRVAEAMVDKTLGYENYAKPGQILALTDYQAAEAGYADIVAEDLSKVFAHYNLADSEVIFYTSEFNEKAVSFFSNQTIKSILLSIMVLAILAEIKTAGTGVAGAIGILAAVLFFGSQWLAGLVGWLEVLLFIAGLMLIAVEFFIPGITLFGIGGVVAIFTSIFLVLGANTQALNLLALSMIIGIVVFILIMKRLPSSRLWSKLVLKDSETDNAGYISSDDYRAFLGREGIAISSLRPSGVIEIDGIKLDVVTDGGFLPKGTNVKVVSISGNRIVVKKSH